MLVGQQLWVPTRKCSKQTTGQHTKALVCRGHRWGVTQGQRFGWGQPRLQWSGDSPARVVEFVAGTQHMWPLVQGGYTGAAQWWDFSGTPELGLEGGSGVRF